MSSANSVTDGRLPMAEIPRGTTLESYLRQVTEDVQQLEEAIKTLPRVQLDGSSECPFAERLYARKDKLAGGVASSVQMMNRYLAVLVQEINRCQQNLKRLGGDRARVRTGPARKGYETATDVQLLELQSAEQDRSSILLVLPRAEAALSVVATKQYPGLRGSSSGSGDRSPTRGQRAGMPAPHNANRELSDLVKLGPVARD